MTRQGRRRRVPAGMTLVEVVVALALFSLVALTLGATLRSMAMSAQRIDERSEAVDEMLAAAAFLGDALSHATVVHAVDGAERRLLFDAGADRLSWVAVMPARIGAAGRHAFRLALETGPDGQRMLVLRHAPLADARPAFPDWSRAEHRVLARAVDRVAIGYEGEGLAQAWPARWPHGDRLPVRIRLDVEGAGVAWPPLVVPVRVPGTAAAGRFVIGGGTR